MHRCRNNFWNGSAVCYIPHTYNSHAKKLWTSDNEYYISPKNAHLLLFTEMNNFAICTKPRLSTQDLWAFSMNEWFNLSWVVLRRCFNPSHCWECPSSCCFSNWNCHIQLEKSMNFETQWFCSRIWIHDITQHSNTGDFLDCNTSQIFVTNYEVWNRLQLCF